MKTLKIVFDVVCIVFGLALLGLLIWVGVSVCNGIEESIQNCGGIR